MKRKAVLFYILIAAAVFGNAQVIDRSRYREITLPEFDAWKQGLPREGTEPALFKARVLFEEVSETAISFADPGNQTFIYFTVDKTWPEMEEGRLVTIYFTAGGSWSWNRVLDEIDRGIGLAQEPPADDPYTGGAGDPAFGQDQYDQYDQAGYGEEPDFDEFDGPDQYPAPAGTAGGGEAEYALPQPAVSQGPAVSVKISGPAPRPGKVYRLQVGAYRVERNAVHALNRLKDAGFSPNYEQHGQYLRVVLSGVQAAHVGAYVERIGRAGFAEVWCREER
jgi:hypothetical protein